MTPPGKARRRVGGYFWRDGLKEIVDAADEMLGLLKQLSDRAESEDAQRLVSRAMVCTYEVRAGASDLQHYQGVSEE